MKSIAATAACLVLMTSSFVPVFSQDDDAFNGTGGGLPRATPPPTLEKQDWEGKIADNYTALFYFRKSNTSDKNEFVDKWSKMEAPRDWWWDMVFDCFKEDGRCRKERSLRGLQEARTAYIRVLFGDTQGQTVSNEAKDIFYRAAKTWSFAITENNLFPANLLMAVGSRTDPVNLGMGCAITDDTFYVAPSNSDEPATLTILAQVAPIDGLRGILAQAGPCIVADDVNGRRQSYLGRMTFDEPDFNAQLASDPNALFNTVLHEMGHILGIGTLWLPGFLRLGSVPGAPREPTFSGEQAIAANALFTDSEIPNDFVQVESEGGQGTANSHWDDGIYANELMTGFLNSGSNPLSILTIASLRDIGLVVDDCAGEDYGGYVRDVEACASFFNQTLISQDGNTTFTFPLPTDDPLSNLTPWEIAGIAIGGFAILALVGLACSWACSTMQQQKSGPIKDERRTEIPEAKPVSDGVPVQDPNQQSIHIS